MARFIIASVLLGLCLALCNACSSSSGRTPSWDVNDNTEIYPTYDPGSGAVGVGVTIRFRRSTSGDEKQDVFNMIDRSSDGYIDICEWTKEGGSARNFLEFVDDDDKNGDEKISFKEFQNIHIQHNDN